ncbi:MAG TPA: DUF58 domain-containing protein [Streptosporangiaceae bacterium]|nr:DUF58 domain-containing protein [Streptosporangiaceae bacterium]
MRSLLAGLTTRGTSFVAAGLAAAAAGLLLGERSLLSVGALLFVLPLLAALAASRARYRLSCQRTVSPPRVPAGHTARVTLRLENISRFPSGLMLAEDTVPGALGTRPRYVLDGIERGGVRVLSYPLRSDLRGKFEIGPLEVRIADAFGLVELGRSFAARSTLIVTPKIVPLDRGVVAGSWLGEGDGRSRTAAAAGEDDVVPRAYRDGDELRRVHWRSTARYGELMVRREEQRRKNRAMLLLDTRRGAHSGSGASSSFEFAISAAASIGVHLAREGLDGELITDTGPVSSPARFEDVLLDSLSVIRNSGSSDLSRGTGALRGARGGLIVVVAGMLSAAQARELAASRRDGCPAIALLLAVSSWAEPPARDAGEQVRRRPDAARPAAARTADRQAGPGAAGNGRKVAGPDETAPAAAVLRAAGWRVMSVDASTSLALAWQRLPRFAGAPAAAGAAPRPLETAG